MLAILFVSIRMRAQEVTGELGAPQIWAQAAMYVCTIAVAVQLLICLLLGAVTGTAPEVDEHESFPVSQSSNLKGSLLEKVAVAADWCSPSGGTFLCAIYT